MHDYGFHPRGSWSVNSIHSSTSVIYNTTKQNAEILDGTKWLIKADLESGFRQFGTNPADWRFQVYCGGPSEHYIDIACPFGKTNSTLEFCPPVSLFAKSVAFQYAKSYGGSIPRFGTHVDDIYGGLKGCSSYERAYHLRNYLCQAGTRLTLHFNMDVKKTPLPARSQVILGRQ